MISDEDWRKPTGTVSLKGDTLHVWRAWLDVGDDTRRWLASHLSRDELARAGRYHSSRDRERFIVARGILRTLLGNYLDVAPAQLVLGRGSHGKPHLERPRAGLDLRFNVSHSGDLALYVFALDRDVGIDVERVHELPDAEAVAKVVFSPQEVVAWRSLPPGQRSAGFFACWTRKEAYIKARGRGLSLPLASFSVSVAPSEPAALLNEGSAMSSSTCWSLRDVHVSPAFAATLAVEGRVLRQVLYQWTPGHEGPDRPQLAPL